jgi:uncharacterized protein YbaR (Trm112 family)
MRIANSLRRITYQEKTTISAIFYTLPPEPLNGAFKGRGRHYLTLLRCPLDHAALRLDEDALVCTADDQHHYPFENGVLSLIPLDQREAVKAASAAYDQERAAQGWESPDEAGFKSLPQTGLSGYGEGYWAQQAAATALLWRFLEIIRLRAGILPVGPMGEAAVIGAGMGWLAYALDVAGFTTIALDLYAGPRYGLSVYPIARYLRVQGDPVVPPLARSAFDLLIYQEGLARSDEDQHTALDNALQLLRPGGSVAVMNALNNSDEHNQRTQTLLIEAGLDLMDIPRRRGVQGKITEIGSKLTGRGAHIPPVIVATKSRQ